MFLSGYPQSENKKIECLGFRKLVFQKYFSPEKVDDTHKASKTFKITLGIISRPATLSVPLLSITLARKAKLMGECLGVLKQI